MMQYSEVIVIVLKVYKVLDKKYRYDLIIKIIKFITALCFSYNIINKKYYLFQNYKKIRIIR